MSCIVTNITWHCFRVKLISIKSLEFDKKGLLSLLWFETPFTTAQPRSRGEGRLMFKENCKNWHFKPPLLLRGFPILLYNNQIDNRSCLGSASHALFVSSRFIIWDLTAQGPYKIMLFWHHSKLYWAFERMSINNWQSTCHMSDSERFSKD